jgi:hypothetical protein
MLIKNDILLITLNYHIFQNETYYPDEPFLYFTLDGVCRRLKWGKVFATMSHNVNQPNPVEEKLTEKNRWIPWMTGRTAKDSADIPSFAVSACKNATG